MKLKVKSKKAKVIFILLILFLFASGCRQNESTKKEEGPQVVPVKVSRVQPRDLSEVIEYAANIKAQEEVAVYPKVSGKIMEKIKKDGEPVAKAEAIAYIDRDEVGLKFENAPVESPISGTFAKYYVDIGASVTPQTQIALVVDMDAVKIMLDVPEKYLSKISVGKTAVITTDAYPNDEFTGEVTKITPVMDTATRTAAVEIKAVNNEHKLRSGMFAKARLVVQEYKAAPSILKEAIIGKGADIYVYCIEGKKAVLKEVSLGIRQGPYVQVLSGLNTGDAVVVMGQQRLKEGAIVEAEE